MNSKPQCPACGRFLPNRQLLQLKIAEIPQPETGKGRQTYWDNLLEQIPVGKAMVIPLSIMSTISLSSMLCLRKKRGLFKNYQVVRYKDNTYIVNSQINAKVPFDIVDAHEAGENLHFSKKDWEALFSAIPKGKALVIPVNIRTYTGLAYQIKRFQKRGKFLNYYVVFSSHGEPQNYVVNPMKS